MDVVKQFEGENPRPDHDLLITEEVAKDEGKSTAIFVYIFFREITYNIGQVLHTYIFHQRHVPT